MNKMDKVRKKIKLLLIQHPILLRYTQYLYFLIFKRGRLIKKKRYGENIPDKTILLIRPNSEDGVQGLMSLFIQTMRWYEFACLLYTSPSPRDPKTSRMPSSA